MCDIICTSSHTMDARVGHVMPFPVTCWWLQQTRDSFCGGPSAHFSNYLTFAVVENAVYEVHYTWLFPNLLSSVYYTHIWCSFSCYTHTRSHDSLLQDPQNQCEARFCPSAILVYISGLFYSPADVYRWKWFCLNLTIFSFHLRLSLVAFQNLGCPNVFQEMDTTF